MGNRERRGAADEQPGDRQVDCVQQHQAHDLRPAGAKRDAQANLPCPSSDGVGHDAVDADRGHGQRNQAAQSNERGRQAIEPQRLRQVRLER
jgi:hypothetical protein